MRFDSHGDIKSAAFGSNCLTCEGPMRRDGSPLIGPWGLGIATAGDIGHLFPSSQKVGGDNPLKFENIFVQNYIKVMLSFHIFKTKWPKSVDVWPNSAHLCGREMMK